MTTLTPSDSLSEKSLSLNGAFPIQPPSSSETIYNDARLHRIELPDVNGITHARSLARIYARLIGDINDSGNKKKRLISEKTLAQAIEKITPEGETDRVMFGILSTFGRGDFQTHGYTLDVFDDGVYGHIGIGGSCALAYPPHQLAYAFVCNHIDIGVLAVNVRSIRLLDAIQNVILHINTT